MPQRQLTDRFCDRVNAESQIDYFDEAMTGLALRVSPTKKAWIWLHTGLDGKRKRLTFGTYPAISLAAARGKVELMRRELEAGLPPKTETFRAICEEYLRRAKVRTKSERQRTLERLVYPSLGSRPIDDIRRSEIVKLLDGIEDASGPVMADRTLALVRKIMNWHASRSDDFRSPIVKGMARTKPSERARERTLTDDEIRALWRACKGVFGRFVQFLLLTGARRGEAAQMKRSELSGGDWTLPAARNKTKVDLVRPLSNAAQAIVEELPGPPVAGAKSKTECVFTTDGLTPISGFSKFKRAFDEASGVRDYTLHDLRRTTRTLMSRAGVDKDHAERCLGHVIPGVRGVYDRHEYHAEKHQAYEALAALVERIVSGTQAGVVQLRGRKQ
jgi:integrase